MQLSLLEKMPEELKCMIFANLPSERSKRSLARTSTHLYHVFTASEMSILRQQVRANQDVFELALFTLQIRSTGVKNWESLYESLGSRLNSFLHNCTRSQARQMVALLHEMRLSSQSAAKFVLFPDRFPPLDEHPAFLHFRQKSIERVLQENARDVLLGLVRSGFHMAKIFHAPDSPFDNRSVISLLYNTEPPHVDSGYRREGYMHG